MSEYYELLGKALTRVNAKSWAADAGLDTTARFCYHQRMPTELDYLLIVDTETTGLPEEDPTAKCIEVALVVYSIRSRCVVAQYAELIQSQTNGAENVNRIPVSALEAAGPAVFVWNAVERMVAAVPGEKVYMAHQADFDAQWFPKFLAAKLPWIDSKLDVEWPRSKVGDGLAYVALAHDVPVVSAHRAMTDCMLLAQITERVQREFGDEKLQTLLARALRPKGLFMVAATGFDEQRNALAKKAGFRWDPGAKRWTRRMAVEDATEAALGFSVRRIDASPEVTRPAQPAPFPGAEAWPG